MPITVEAGETRALLKNLDEVVKEWQKFDYSSAYQDNDLKQICLNFDRAKRRFGSTSFFIVIFGPLKAGKSTLANVLANDYVSPTGFGIETTRRPSLVMGSNEHCIEQYFSTDSDINNALRQFRVKKSDKAPHSEMTDDIKKKFRNEFELVYDYLREVGNEEEFQKYIHIKRLDLNEKNLKEVLTGDFGSGWEPLFTAIRCKKSELLNNKVVIVDMPGLDGTHSNWKEDPIHEWVIQQADYFFFCQSSVAAINMETKDFIRDIVGPKSSRPPIYLIQNIFEARTWQPQKVQQADIDQQRDDGAERLKNILEMQPRTVGLNLGKAWDGKNAPDKEWLGQTKFPEFEKDFVETLNSERSGIHENNCVKNLRNKIEEAEKILTQLHG